MNRTAVVELLWFSDCPNHQTARAMLEEVIAEVAPGATIRDIDASDPTVAGSVRFPGSPTIRVDGRDIDPTFTDTGDYTPRCRLYRTSAGLRGLPERDWIIAALQIESAVATAGAMKVMHWKRTSGSPIAFRSRLAPPLIAAMPTSLKVASGPRLA